MKSLIKKLLREGLEEARSIEGQFSREENIGELLTHISQKYKFVNTYVSFRDSKHVTKINPDNRFNTPTGLYTYRLSDYLDGVTYNLDNFRSAFPFAQSRKYIQFLIPKNNAQIIDSDYMELWLDDYVEEIQKKYGKINPVNGLCERWLNEEYQSYYSEAKHPAHKFWLFLFDVIPYIYPKGEKNNSFAILCRELGIDGFSDDKCEGWIHPNEKCQTVFFKSNIFKDQFILEPKDDDMLAKKGEYTDNQIIKMLSQHRLNPIRNVDEIIPHLGNKKIAKYMDKIFSGMEPQSLSYMLTKTKYPEKLISTLGSVGSNLLLKLNSYNFNTILGRNPEPDKIIKVLLMNDELIDNLDSIGIAFLLRHTNEPKKVINMLGEKGKEYISNMDTKHLFNTLLKSKQPLEVVDMLGEWGEKLLNSEGFINAFADYSISRGEVKSKNPEEFKTIIKKYISGSELDKAKQNAKSRKDSEELPF